MFGRDRIEYKTPDQMRIMRRAGLVVADLLDAVRERIRPGVTTGELDEVAARVIADAGATSNFLHYHGFPARICVSVNSEVVHGIPGERVIEPGDVVAVDGGAIVDGWHGDSAFSVVVPDADPADLDLVRVTEESMWAGIAALATAERLGQVGEAIDDVVTAAGGLGIVAEYVGHGIGSAMHQPPDVLNYRSGHRGPRVRAGMCLAVEPMLVRGEPATAVLADDWTVVTVDGSRAAHFEHTVAVHPGGIWVLTARDGGVEGLARHGVRVAPLG
ncbi:type I methionyl aminopeptidase [Occultella glacieicola]|uniref:Methionine aminopeptidase n=1 Tax=Occultella glacieicola TaxID=2518684 RepID=A0ABY2E1V0_9MICO|nr:type I methionyl aminopeptidase [Occultella glacieicola]TDE88496.1 type I methionyl aminopeptidase [Occultella glacieicola]